MRKSKKVMAESRGRIITTAARMLRERGVDGTSLADLMHAAGMTHGGFYKHFASKDELSNIAARAAFEEIATRFDERKRAMGPDAARDAYFDEYFSVAHIEHPEAGCPVAAFGTDAGRHTDALAAAFADGAEMLIARIASEDGSPAKRAEAIRKLATAVGAVVVARAIGSGALREEVLKVCGFDRALPLAP